jgi:midasin
MLGIQRWSRITVLPPTDDDLLTIITQSHPRLSFIAPTILQVYVALRDQSSPLGKSARPVSPRDLLKWAKRTAFHCTRLTGETIPREIWEDIFLEAIDCFAAQIPSSQARAATIERIGAEMGFPTERVKLYLESHAPPLKNSAHAVSVGRVSVSKARRTPRQSTRPFAYTNHAKKLLEQLAVAHIHREPILLVGETGTGKTTIVQHLADLLHHRLIVVNVSQQTESSDLLGGFKPVDVRTLAVQLNESFEGLFEKTFSAKRNEAFMTRVREVYAAQNWTALVKLISSAVAQAEARFAQPAKEDEDGGAKKKRKVDSSLKAEWAKFADSLKSFEAQHASGKGKAQAFSFVEGSLVKALRRGDWLLLDEINLAASDTLESIAGLIRDGGSITLPEKGDLEAIKPHPDFRIFAAMNPATDVGKRDLPPTLRGQFTELYVGSPDELMADLLLIIKQYIGHLMVGDERSASDVANLYLRIKGAAESHEIVDGVGQKPHFSVRTLSRTLTYVGDTAGMYGLRRALYEGFCMSFTTMLEKSSRDAIVQAIVDGIYPSANRNVRSALRSLPKRPQGNVVQLGHYWIETGPDAPQENPLYIVKQHTSVEQNLHNLVRASVTRRYPILLQGPTSSGKTSMVEHLAKLTGHKFLRINNHEHTSLDEYLGTYISTPTGSFVFQEGVLVQALRKGHWIVLDELNLAPTDVLEALNRLLDDNRELLIPETQEVVRPHPHFMLFATQNPAGLYGGRKVLSRAFRNRFLELEFEDIPEHELEEILCLRCSIPPSYGAKVVEVYKQLSLRRQSTRLFEKGNSFATLRDLFRWAQREAVGYQQLAENGYMLLAERVRKPEERGVVKEVIEKVMRVKIDELSLYDLGRLGEDLVRSVEGVIWTKAMRRLFILVREALVNNEPVLLVGETGSGKTTVCQVLADYMAKELHVINAHQNTETGDIIGGQRPYRDRARYQAQLTNQLRSFFSDRPETTEMDLEGLSAEFGKLDVQSLLTSPETPDSITSHIEQIRESWNRHNILFEWVDGTLVQAMKQGEPFLLDEISLADDSVLERLNSVLESTRTIVLAEKGGEDVSVVAATGFQFFATMNPGGDYGKKELSPALRNRFTEIWVPAVDDREDLVQISQASLVEGMKDAAEVIVEFAEWFMKNIGTTGATISIRDIIAWVQFVNATHGFLGRKMSLYHGAMMVYVDGIGATSGTEFVNISATKSLAVDQLGALLDGQFTSLLVTDVNVFVNDETKTFFLGEFGLPVGFKKQTVPFSFASPTTIKNGMKVLRAMQLPKSILLEGAPGIGKTTLIQAIADMAGRPLTRINLSDQTDLMDLFGADAPVEGGRGGEFAWRDAPFLRAMQFGEWVLLDELNLASQSVLEGLNACLDHRGTAFVPELNRSFTRHPDFRIFAAQNPHVQGGGRKGLPKSFINRFSVVYVDALQERDMCIIGHHLFPAIDNEIIAKLIHYVAQLQEDANSNTPFGSLGRPWEFNLRDVLRWLELVGDQLGIRKGRSPGDYLHVLISQRLRSQKDREHAESLFEKSVSGLNTLDPTYSLAPDSIQFGLSLCPRASTTPFDRLLPKIPVELHRPMEALGIGIEKSWPVILVGSSGSGKTAMIRTFAALHGASLREISMNSDTDATDLVGGYEQYDMVRQIREISGRIKEGIRRLIQSAGPGQITRSECTKLFAVFSDLSSSRFIGQSIRSTLKAIVTGIQGRLPDKSAGPLPSQLQEILTTVMSENANRKFQWYDGTLVDALAHGDWVVLDNANLCNPSVLDRLNSLLEPNGSLVLHECTNTDGEPRVIKPHSSFRLFLSMDPRHGELSRAMRNRALEIALLTAPKIPLRTGINIFEPITKFQYLLLTVTRHWLPICVPSKKSLLPLLKLARSLGPHIIRLWNTLPSKDFRI